MVRREVTSDRTLRGEREPVIRCTSPAGESPAPVSIGAPDSRPQVMKRELRARAGRQEPARQRELRSGEQAHGPQHQVKPAASTDSQSAGRADHVTAKATSSWGAPKPRIDCGGVWGAARVQGEVRNTRDPSAQSESGQGGSYKPKAKSSAVQRESEGTLVLQSVVRATRRVELYDGKEGFDFLGCHLHKRMSVRCGSKGASACTSCSAGRVIAR